MKTEITRRTFLAKGSMACAGCALLASGGDSLAATGPVSETLDPKEFTYCGYKCTPECPLLKATQANDAEMKKKVFEEWGAAEQYGIEFDPETYFCHGCKNVDSPKGFPVRHCTIIPCAQEKGFDCCFQCKELSACDKELWEKFPKHREYVLGLQQNYFSTME